MSTVRMATYDGSIPPRRSIHKHSVPIEDFFSVELPRDARFLHVAFDAARLRSFMWFEVSTLLNVDTEFRPFGVRGTGNPVYEGEHYLGTWQEGPFWWHLYELPPR